MPVPIAMARVSLGAVAGFDGGDFFDAALVAACGKGSGEPDGDDFACELGREHFGAEGEDVGVVVFAAVAGGGGIVAEGGADAGDFVCGDGGADAGGIENDGAGCFTAGDGECGFFSEVGVVHGGGGIGAEVEDGMAEGLEPREELLLEIEAAVIGGKGDGAAGGGAGLDEADGDIALGGFFGGKGSDEGIVRDGNFTAGRDGVEVARGEDVAGHG